MIYGRAGHYMVPKCWTKRRRQCYTTTRRNRGEAERSEGERGERSHRAEGMPAREVSSRVPAGESQ